MLTLHQVFECFEQIWPSPTEMWIVLKKFSTILLLNIGHGIVPLLQLMKSMLENSESTNRSEPLSWNLFVQQLSEGDYATTSFQSEIIMTAVRLLTELQNKDITDNSSSLATMKPSPGTTSTSSTTALGTPGLADATPLEDCDLSGEDELNGPENYTEVKSSIYFQFYRLMFSHFAVN